MTNVDATELRKDLVAVILPIEIARRKGLCHPDHKHDVLFSQMLRFIDQAAIQFAGRESGGDVEFDIDHNILEHALWRSVHYGQTPNDREECEIVTQSGHHGDATYYAEQALFGIGPDAEEHISKCKWRPKYPESIFERVARNYCATQSPAKTVHDFDYLQELVEAGRAVVRRWNEPSWKDVPATAEYINRLRDALEAYGPESAAKTVQGLVEDNRAVLRELLVCFAAWQPDVCVVGNVRAGDAYRALLAAGGVQGEMKSTTGDDNGNHLR